MPAFDYWDKKAEGAFPTIQDTYYWELETDYIASKLQPNWKVLDIGCGTGVTTQVYAQKSLSVLGVDFSPAMVARAKRECQLDNVKFMEGDAHDIAFIANRTFDCVIMQRCLINLLTRRDQQEAVLEVLRVLKPGGLFIDSEVTIQGHEAVNQMRGVFGLSPLKVHWHNKYLDEGDFLHFLEEGFEQVSTHRFGMYHLISKVIHPLLVHPEEPQFDAPINEIALHIAEKYPEFGNLSHHVIFSGIKREAKSWKLY